MALTATERKRRQRENKSQGGLFKPYEIYAHPSDLAELKEVEHKLQQKWLTKPEENKMKTIYTIPQKSSNSGTIHDIASDMYDRDIVFGKDCVFAVVLSSYYGGKGYTTHQTEEAAIKKGRKLSKEGVSHQIIDKEGNSYAIGGRYQDKLIKKDW